MTKPTCLLSDIVTSFWRSSNLYSYFPFYILNFLTLQTQISHVFLPNSPQQLPVKGGLPNNLVLFLTLSHPFTKTKQKRQEEEDYIVNSDELFCAFLDPPHINSATPRVYKLSLADCPNPLLMWLHHSFEYCNWHARPCLKLKLLYALWSMPSYAIGATRQNI